MAGAENSARPYRTAADCRYLRFARTRKASPAEPSAAWSVRYFAGGFADKPLRLFNVAWFDATIAACPPTCFGSQRRRATPTFTTTSARSGRRSMSRGPAVGKGARVQRASRFPTTGPIVCRSLRLSWTFSRSISVRFSMSCWAQKTNFENGGPA